MSQILYLRLICAFCQRMLAPALGKSPESIRGLHAFWQSLQLFPGMVILAVVQVCHLCCLGSTLLSWSHSRIYGKGNAKGVCRRSKQVLVCRCQW